MPNIQPYNPSTYLAPREARRTARAVGRYQADGALREVAINVETDVMLAKLDSYTLATVSGMQDVVRVGKAQEAMEQLAPSCSARLNFLAEQHTLGVSGLLTRFEQRLGRC